MGVIFGLGAAFIYSIYILVGSRITKQVTAIQSSTVVIVSAAIVSSGLVAIKGPAFPETASGWASPAWQAGQPLRLVTVGRLTPEMNMLAVIVALPQIRLVHRACSLDVVGNGPSRPVLESRVRELGLVDAVAFHGNVSHERVLQILSSSHLFVFPTRVREGFPKAVLEAMACGLPVIATRVSVLPQLIGDGAGLLLEDTSSAAVAQAVLQVTSGPQRMAGMGRLARQAARAYTLEGWAQADRRTFMCGLGSAAGDEMLTKKAIDKSSVIMVFRLKRFMKIHATDFLHGDSKADRSNSASSDF